MLNIRAKAPTTVGKGPAPGIKSIARNSLGKLTWEKTIVPDCLLKQPISLVAKQSNEKTVPMNRLKQVLRFPGSVPSVLKKKLVQGKELVKRKQGQGRSSGFLSCFRKKKELFDDLDLSESRKSSSDGSALLETKGSYGEEMTNNPAVQLQLEDRHLHDQEEEPELDNSNVPFLDRITVFYPIEDEYDTPSAANEIETFPFTIYDDFRLRAARSEESKSNSSNDKATTRFAQSTNHARARSDSFDISMVGARILQNFQRTESDLLDLPFKSPVARNHESTLLRASLSSDDLARYDRTSLMENMASSQWSMDFDSVSQEPSDGHAMLKWRCRSDPSLASERSNGYAGGMSMIEVHCRSDPSLGEHSGAVQSSRTPCRASPSFECMLVDTKRGKTDFFEEEEIIPARNAMNIDGTGSPLRKKETTPARSSIQIDDSRYQQLSKTSRSRSDPSAVANIAFATSSFTPTQPTSPMETTVEMKRSRSAATETTSCLLQDGGNLLTSSEFARVSRFHPQPVTVPDPKDGELALTQGFQDRCSRLVSSDDDQTVARVFSTLLSPLDRMCPGDVIDVIGSKMFVSTDRTSHFPKQSLRVDASGSEVSASISGTQSFKQHENESTASASWGRHPTPSLKQDASGRGSVVSASHSHSQSFENAEGAHEGSLEARNDGLKDESPRRDLGHGNNNTDMDIHKDSSNKVNIHAESCPKTEGTPDGLLPLPPSEDFSALTGTSMSSDDGLYLLTSVDVLEVATNPTPVHPSGCLAMAAHDISNMARCEMASRRLVSTSTCEYSACSLAGGDETVTSGKSSTKDGSLTEVSSSSFFAYGCLHPVSTVLPLYVDFCHSIME